MTRTELIQKIVQTAEEYNNYPVSDSGMSSKNKAWLESRLVQLTEAVKSKREYKMLKDGYTTDQWLASAMGYDSGIPKDVRVAASFLYRKADHLWNGNSVEDSARMAQDEVDHGYSI